MYMRKIAASLDFGEMRLSGYDALAWERSSKFISILKPQFVWYIGTLIKGTFDY